MVQTLTVAAECAFEDVVDEVADGVWGALVTRTGRLFSGYRVAVRGIIRGHLVAARAGEGWRVQGDHWIVALHLPADTRSFSMEIAQSVAGRLEEVLRGRPGTEGVERDLAAAVVASLAHAGRSCCGGQSRDRHMNEGREVAA